MQKLKELTYLPILFATGLVFLSGAFKFNQVPIESSGNEGIMLEMFCLGAGVILGFYHIGLYFLHRKNQEALFLGLMSFALAFLADVCPELWSSSP